MALSEPVRAIRASAVVTVTLGLASGILLRLGPDTAIWGLTIFLAMPLVIALVAAWHVHAINAMLISAAFSALALFSIGWLCDCLELMVLELPILGASMVAGGILGVLVRALGRKANTNHEGAKIGNTKPDGGLRGP